MKVIKRDGSKQEFDFGKVEYVLSKAFNSVNQTISIKFLEQLKDVFSKIKKQEIDVEEIQDVIQKELIKRNQYDVAESFIIYRNKRAEVREQKSDLIKDIRCKLQGSNIENQNANLDEASFGGRMGEAASIVAKNDALKYKMSKKSRKNHENNEIYIHDLDSYSTGMHNCLSMPLDKLLNEGFKTRQTDVRPANSVNTAMQLVAVLFQLQSLQQFGGVSATHLDWTMVPFVRKSFYKYYMDGLKFIYNIVNIDDSHKYSNELSIDDDKYKLFPKAYDYANEMINREVYQAVEGMYHNLNTLQSRSGNQLPFSSINYGTCILPEGRLVIKALLDISINGLGKFGRTSIFPCGIFQYSKEINGLPGTPNYDLYKLALKSTSLRLYPNYCNIDWSGNAGYDKNDPRTYMSTMGCRTVNGYDINGFGYLKDGRGNICPVTIIMPTLAMQVDGEVGAKNVKEFIKLLDKKIHEAKDMLIERFNHICSQSPKAAKFMWENNTMEGYDPKEGIKSALKHGTIVIGQLGLAETLQILIGCDHTEERGMDLAKEIEGLFNKRCKEFKEEYKLNFGVYYTPAENLCYTAMSKFKRMYGEIPKVSDKKYFTNSIHVPVWKEIDPFTKIDIESQLTGYSNAGCITYVELPSSAKHNIEALEAIVNYAMDKDIPYFALNTIVDRCEDCGYTDEINDCCPKCNSNNIQRLRRITGYLNGDYRTSFNKGKQQEVLDRVKHIK